MDRQPVVAGRFYPGAPKSLAAEVSRYLGQAEPPGERRTILAMVPHAGYVFSGHVAGKTLGRARLAGTLILLGPSHTGRGARLAVWPSGRWHFPGGSLTVDRDLAAAMVQADSRLTADVEAHVGEHSLEVVLPFLWSLDPDAAIVPIAVSEPGLETLLSVGQNLAGVATGLGREVSLVVSSDMSHYLPQDLARDLDAMALSEACALDPAGLFRVVRSKGISMCGVLPMTLGLAAALKLGATKAEVAAYATSGDVSGDRRQVVGYAGVLVS
ncbi:MAG: AmmeMemoRadiSam system protein B [Desulfovibrionaceae bacterium]|nr:AmmeMemoRadiSam system protein B [Desulfovibrionaceae bacterium]